MWSTEFLTNYDCAVQWAAEFAKEIYEAKASQCIGLFELFHLSFGFLIILCLQKTRFMRRTHFINFVTFGVLR